jgi:hypothetical protein
MKAMRPLAYISGALSNVEDLAGLKRFYERLGAICEAAGIRAYVPHLQGTDPVANAELPPREVYRRDMTHVDAADLVIAYVGERSLGVGAEIERAGHTGADVLLLFEDGLSISRLIRGAPAVWTMIRFHSFEEAESLLAAELARWRQQRVGPRAMPSQEG